MDFIYSAIAQLAFHLVGYIQVSAMLLFRKWFLIWNKVIENLSFASNLNGFLKADVFPWLHLYFAGIMEEIINVFDFTGWPKSSCLTHGPFRPSFTWVIEKLYTVFHENPLATSPYETLWNLNDIILDEKKNFCMRWSFHNLCLPLKNCPVTSTKSTTVVATNYTTTNYTIYMEFIIMYCRINGNEKIKWVTGGIHNDTRPNITT